MIDNEMSFIIGARTLHSLTSTQHLRGVRDSRVWSVIDSETDALPVGPERFHWNADALAKLEGEIHRAESWARAFGLEECVELRDFCASKIGKLQL
jgi:hypothetical protein